MKSMITPSWKTAGAINPSGGILTMRIRSLLSFWLTSLEFFNVSNCFIKTILFYRLSPDQEGNLDDSIVCNQIAVNKKGQVLQEIISLHQSFTRRRSRSSIKSETSILTRSSYRDSPIPPEGKGFSKIRDMKFLI